MSPWLDFCLIYPVEDTALYKDIFKITKSEFTLESEMERHLKLNPNTFSNCLHKANKSSYVQLIIPLMCVTKESIVELGCNGASYRPPLMCSITCPPPQEVKTNSLPIEG